MPNKFSLKRFIRSRSRSNRESGSALARGNEIRDMNTDQATRQPSKHAQDHFTYSWTIRSFNELVTFYPNAGFVLSDRFWSPRPPLTTDFSPTKNKQNDHPYLWRIKLYPNGVNEAAKGHISLYLVAIQTPYEKETNITFRDKTFKLEVYRLTSDPNSTPFSSSVPTLIRNETFTMKFEFDGLDDFGRHRFCSFENLFPNSDTSADIDLLIKVHVFNTTTTDDSSDEPIEQIESEFPSFKQHLDDGKFSDVEFTFDCGSVIKAHRIILATRSSYFEKLLGDKWKEGQMKTIPIKHMEYTTFRSILYYLYTGKLEVRLEFDVLKDVYSKADMLNLERFGEMVAERIADMVNSNNWDEILLLAWEVGDSRLKEAALDYAVTKWDEIRDSENMKRVMACGNMGWIEELMKARYISMQIS
ncbi:hypothetical protein RclHR1_00450034 [Rhizophagus clarus]|uniref:BTB/POZ protein n=1 Tax=Rhizophagus clarus TaxID=94130 RepID=A0A2Z6SC19_9GLOM|nr:hypothetical protein RclHR1_00450034 [Rhizophagus clarus]GES73693.1 BTB/POZ protein [Rhizophagus clarus]